MMTTSNPFFSKQLKNGLPTRHPLNPFPESADSALLKFFWIEGLRQQLDCFGVG